ncbi:hypothetical protein BDU57DRAFT_589732 [Ampelomyces quisqualis]|uniref:Uncharacterized protein n=1 Tax=Ampelomyces quisqualis TaxID=50730 RepID=A0A6A5QBH1_AMPQU|nr:hypothetical protein BDU57DRAFT_589732 [Ampelomyces quisqualis]
MGSPLAKNNAFGVGSPSWNLPFPSGNLTAAEILAYLPHWIKSVDVVDRFITNGGKSFTIAAVINEFRQLPGNGDAVFRPNSAQIMMSYAMRRAGFEEWTVGTHWNFERPDPSFSETDLNVQTFRLPCETHPKSHPSGKDEYQLKLNEPAEPIEFKTLALHIKVHPSGCDALDLARCVQYAVAHPDENWSFPNDFGLLVTKLGGPAVITHSHLDRQIFRRREAYFIEHSMAPTSGSPLKRMMDADGLVQVGGRRKSGRLANKVTVNLRDYDSDATDVEDYRSSRSGYSFPAKKRRLNRIPATPGSPSNDSDFSEVESEPDDEVPEAELVSDDELISPIKAARSRTAARKASQIIRSLSTETQRNIEDIAKRKLVSVSRPVSSPQRSQMPPSHVPKLPVVVSPEVMSLARAFVPRQPIYLPPPVLSANRLRVDSSTLFLYAADGCTTEAELWASALSSTRFNGPRRHPPFRELHRLTDPHPHDVSDWAENIRWAKEQHAVFGSDTWTEYDHHLELVTAHRRMMWASEEAIMSRS